MIVVDRSIKDYLAIPEVLAVYTQEEDATHLK